MLRQAHEALQVLRSPTKLVQLVGGNLVAQVLFAVALSACVRAFDEDVTLSQLIVINTMVSLFAGLMPVPGGIGVTEAGLTVGLTAAGVPQETSVRRRHRLPLRQLLPATGLGLVLLPLADQEALPVTRAASGRRRSQTPIWARTFSNSRRSAPRSEIARPSRPTKTNSRPGSVGRIPHVVDAGIRHATRCALDLLAGGESAASSPT